MIHNSKPEQTLIGLILLEPNNYYLVGDRVQPQTLLSEVNKDIWTAFQTLTATHIPITIENVLQRAKKADLNYLMECTSLTTFQSDLESAIKNVLENTVKSNLLTLADRVRLNWKNDHGSEILTKINLELENLNEINSDNDKVVSSSNVLDDLMADMNESRIYGLPSSFTSINSFIYGWNKGSLYIIGARPSQGKSALGLQFAQDTVDLMSKTLFISLEMGGKDLMKRIVSFKSKIDLGYLIQNKCPVDKVNQLKESVERLKNNPIRIYEKSTLYIEDLKSLLVVEKMKSGLDILFIDYLQLIRSRDKNLSRVEEIEKVSRELKALALELEIPIICLAQLNRQTEYRSNKTPTISDLKGSGAIEQDADVVFLIHRTDLDYADDDRKKTEFCKILIAKNRNGKTGYIPSKFIGNQTYFEL